MKTKRKLYSISLASAAMILFLILVSTAAAATAEQSASPMITETQITTNKSNQQSPVIYGDTIVWEDYRNGKYNPDIYMYDLSTLKEKQITTNKSHQFDPAIYGNRIVWTDDRNGNNEIYMYDLLSTSKETRITPDEYAQNPAIYGDRIVWDENSNEGWQIICMYDLSTHQKTQITTNGDNRYSAAIYGDRIVWEDWRNYGGSDIYMYDLSTSTETQITTNESDQLNPSIYGNKIAWTDYRNSIGYGINPNIYIYDLSTLKETRITTSGSEYFPAIYGNRIVWEDYRNGNADIYMYDLSTSKETQITTDTSDQVAPAIYGDRIVWMDNRSGNWDIYMGTLGSSAPVANFTSNVTSGNRPLDVAFTDKSTGNPTAWNWNFGDGTNSTQQNPMHTYSKAGNYTVRLTAINDAGSNTKTKPSYIKVTAVTRPVANFTSNVTSGSRPLDVAFTDESKGTPTAWKWSFGDGTNSTEQNPTHKYSKAGNYTVVLTASNSAGSSKITKPSYIKVKTVTRPVANFTSNVTSGYTPLDVAFTDKSTGTPTSWNWSFGDGINSTEQNPVHKYSKAGNYSVVLTASNSAGSNKITKPSYIKVIKS